MKSRRVRWHLFPCGKAECIALGDLRAEMRAGFAGITQQFAELTRRFDSSTTQIETDSRRTKHSLDVIAVESQELRTDMRELYQRTEVR